MENRQDERDRVEGTVEEIVYSNEANGYTVCIIDAGGEPVTVVGYMPYLSEGEKIKASGSWQVHPNFGRQFRTDIFEKELPNDGESILRYLASGSIKGLGPVTARRIVDKFGSDTLSVIENNPNWLAEIRGITPKRAKEIGEAFCAQFGAREAMMFLGEYFGPSLAAKIYKKYKSASADIVRANPYRLCDEINGIGFEKADKVAQSLGFAPDCEERVKAGIRYVLYEAAFGEGHCFLPYEMLSDQCRKTLKTDKEAIDAAINTCILEQKLSCDTYGSITAYSLPEIRQAEDYSAYKLKLLAKNALPFAVENLDPEIKYSEDKQKITYDGKQKAAIKNAVISGVSVVTGGPGTGKTTVINAIIDILDELKIRYMLAAPTGRAAKRMSEASGKEAKTIHRMLEMVYSPTGEAEFNRNEDNPLTAKLYIIDETSMVDVFLLEALLKAMKNDAMVVFIGDCDQLPPVGPGNALNDIIESGLFCTTKLEHIFRQAEMSQIIVNAHRINDGEEPDIRRKDGDFFFMERHTSSDLISLVCSLCQTRLPNAYKFSPAEDIQVISPTRRGECGTHELNRCLQQALNPPDKRKKERHIGNRIYREGDKVMQTKNNYDLTWIKDGEDGEGIFNGDIGRIVLIDIKGECFVIDFDGRVCEYDFSLTEDLELAYAVTVHKSQGSEYPAVIIPLLQCPYPLMTRNLLYTAVTRAKKLLIAVGDPAIMMKMTHNDRKTVRFTAMPFWLAKE